jgi:putative ATP-dependent endonuclease of OLD family
LASKIFEIHLQNRFLNVLDTFLDVTKSNLFFAKGVILVEGWAEEILIPVIASKMGLDLTQHEISVVNVGSTAYLHFARVFMRRSEPEMKVKCAIVTDLDVRPDTENKVQKESEKKKSVEHNLGMPLPNNVKLNLAKEWTLEWCLFKSPILSDLFKDSVAEVHSRTVEFKKDAVTNQYSDSFEKKLKAKLIDRSLEKTDIALVLSEKIKTNELDFAQRDEYIKYLLEAISSRTHLYLYS